MSKKTNEEILKSLNKANKARREFMAKKAGFTTADAYKQSLLGRGIAESKPTVHIVNLLDASSSMSGGKFDSALAGINAEIVELKTKTDVNYIYTLVKFSCNTKIEKLYSGVPLSEVGTIVETAWGNTALNQALGETLVNLRNTNKGERVLVSVFTDGQENDSRGEFRSNSVLQNLIKECEKIGFTITFIGTDRDVRNVVQNLSINITNTLVHDNTTRGIEKSLKTKLGSTVMYSSKVAAGASNEELLTGFYSKQIGELL